MENPLRFIPKMDDLLDNPEIARFLDGLYREAVLRVLREEIDKLRNGIKNGGVYGDKAELFEIVKKNAVSRLEAKQSDRLKRVINATGVIIHTNLGRAPLTKGALEKVNETAGGYSNLEYDVLSGERRSRMSYVEEMIKDLSGAEAALVVNNNAAAVYLALNSLCKNKEVIVSRGEMVEIGDSFRISEIIAESGCITKEVGTTNKTKLRDYEKCIGENTAAFLKVHRSNFKIVGFTEEVSPRELAELRDDGLIVIEDMGSGILIDLSRYGLTGERTVTDAINDGADIITFSGDKMLGGPQAGIIAGRKKHIDLMKKNQMYRCFRIDKMCLAALEATLSQYLRGDFSDIPVIKMLLEPPENIRRKAEELKAKLCLIPGIGCRVGIHSAMPGGGAVPGCERARA